MTATIKIVSEQNSEYDSGVFPMVGVIRFKGNVSEERLTGFFREDRFPDLYRIVFSDHPCLNLTKLAQKGLILSRVHELIIRQCVVESLYGIDYVLPKLRYLELGDLRNLAFLGSPTLSQSSRSLQGLNHLEAIGRCQNLEQLLCEDCPAITGLHGLENCSKLIKLVCVGSTVRKVDFLLERLPQLSIEIIR